MALTKSQKIAKLKKLGFELTGKELVSDLNTLLLTAKNEPVSTPIEEIEEATGVKNDVQTANGTRKQTVVRYINPELGLTDRVFSLENHGENFHSLAEQFAQKFDGTLDPE